MLSFKKTLAKFDEHRSARSGYSELKSGLSDEVLVEVKKKLLPLELTCELKILYSWANGEKDSGYFKNGYSFNSIDNSINMHSTYRNDVVDIDPEMYKKLKSFFPFFSHEINADIGVFLDGEDAAVYCVSVWDIAFYKIAVDIPHYFESILKCAEKGLYANGCSEEDPHKYLQEENEIFVEINGSDIYPNSDVDDLTKFRFTMD